RSVSIVELFEIGFPSSPLTEQLLFARLGVARNLVDQSHILSPPRRSQKRQQWRRIPGARHQESDFFANGIASVEGQERVDDGESQQLVPFRCALVMHSGPNFISELTAFVENVVFRTRQFGVYRVRQVKPVRHRSSSRDATQA